MKNHCRQLLIMMLTSISMVSGACVSTPAPQPTHFPVKTEFIASAIVDSTVISSETAVPVINPGERHMTLPHFSLRIDEYALKGRPQFEPLKFEPLYSSQNEILAKHFQERSVRFSDNSFFDNFGLNKFALLEAERLIARQSTVADVQFDNKQDVVIDVLKTDRIIYTIQAGPVSPITSLQGLWTYKNHWILEVAYIDDSKDTTQTESFVASGKIVQDGILLNELYGYEETFGFQLMKDKPFYFFKQNGQIGISYEDQEMLLGYEEITHYNCCSAAELNPKLAQNMVAFFAQNNGGWYYVEIGDFQ